jgi:hypothetical protein
LKKRTVVQLTALLLVAAFAVFVGACDDKPNNGGGVTKGALTAKISDATTAKASAVVHTVATGVDTGTSWVTQAEMTALESAISAAQAVANNNDATQEQVDAAVTTLNTAITTFNTAKKAGTKEVGTGANKTALTTKIGEANTAKGTAVVNTAAANVPTGTKWVTQAVMTTFEGAITAAQTVANNASATQAQVDAAVTTLTSAITTFTNAKQDGTKAIDYGTDLSWGTEFTPVTLGLTPGRTTTELMLNWYTSGGVSGKVAKVRFIEGTKAAGGELIVATGAVSVANTNSAHKATVTGLKPGSSYQYSVSNDDINWSPMYNYKAPAAGNFSFAVIADPQLHASSWDIDNRYTPIGGATTAAGWVETMAMIVAKNVNFIASGGDQVDTTSNGNEAEYTSFFAPQGLRRRPFAPVPGNHDRHNPFMYHYNVPNPQTADVNLTFAGTGNPETAQVNMGNYFYLYNNVLFVVLNTAHYPTSTAQAGPYITYFRATLTAAKAAYPTYDWLIVQHHKSTASVGDHIADTDIQFYVEAGFETLMSEMGVDFVLAGHDHVYARSFPLKGMANGKVSMPQKTGRVDGQGKATNSWTNVEDPIYLTFTTGSGLKYYSVAADKTYSYNDTLYVKNNASYPYLGASSDGTATLFGSQNYLDGGLPVSNAAYVQPYIPSYCIVQVNGKTITFSTYPIATVSNEVGKPGYTTASGGNDRAFNGEETWSFSADTPYDTITVTKN